MPDAEPEPELPAVESIVARNLDILRQEWDHCQSGIRGLDGVTMRIRTWAVTLFGGCIVFSLREQSGLILLSAIPMLAIFYGIDVMFKIFQAKFIHRTEVISDTLRDVTAAATLAEQAALLRAADFPCYDKYFNGGKAGTPKRKTARELHTVWLYVATIALAIGGYCVGYQLGFYPWVLPVQDTACQLCSSADTAASARL